VASGFNTFDPFVNPASEVEYDTIGPLFGDASLPLNGASAMRIIGGGFEVRNTTADIYKQGSVTCYKRKTQSDEQYYALRMVKDDGNWSFLPSAHVRCVDLPPPTLAMAKQINGVTYEAQEGVLVPVIFDCTANHPRKFNTEPVVFVSGNTPTNATVTFNGASTALSDAQPALVAPCSLDYDQNSGVFSFPGSCYEAPCAQAGAYFTGLSANTTLTVDFRCFVEVFPSVGDTSYALARLAPEYEPKVSRIIEELTEELLPGYPVGMNAKGDFFREVASSLGEVGKSLLWGNGQDMVLAGLSASNVPGISAAAQTAAIMKNLGQTIHSDIKARETAKQKPKQAKAKKVKTK